MFTKNNNFIRISDARAGSGCNSLPNSINGIVTRGCGSVEVGGSGGEPSYPTFFEAGTVEYPFAGSIGSPTTTDANWTEQEMPTTYYGEYAVMPGTSDPTDIYDMLISTHFGDVDKFELESTVSNYTTTAIFGGLASSDSTAKPLVRNNFIYIYSQNNVATSFASFVDGVLTNNVSIDINSLTVGLDVVFEVNGSDITVTGTGTRDNATTYSINQTFTNAYNPNVQYATMGGFNTGPNIVTVDRIYIEGSGFPYSA